MTHTRGRGNPGENEPAADAGPKAAQPAGARRVGRPSQEERDARMSPLPHLAKFRAAADRLGVAYKEVDRLTGELPGTFRRRCEGVLSTPPDALIKLMALFPLTDEAIAAETAEDVPDGRLLDARRMGRLAATPEMEARARLVEAGEHVAAEMARRGVETREEMGDLLSLALVLRQFGFGPRELYDAIRSIVAARAVEDAVRAGEVLRQGPAGGGGSARDGTKGDGDGR